ncbi:MAG: metal ABC transporter permease, partial [Acidimicrobiia bacterium]|nr:metal ABC transporter permease [Acidimicrobiia bacterium]
LARSFRATVALAVAVGLVSVVLGLAAARQWDLAPGGSIVLAAALIFGVVSLLAGRRRVPITPEGALDASPEESGRQQTGRTDG